MYPVTDTTRQIVAEIVHERKHPDREHPGRPSPSPLSVWLRGWKIARCQDSS